MDIMMPHMNGYEATRAIRTSSHEEAQSIPIIAMTANAYAEDVAKAIESGMNAHISKPIDMNHLFSVLGQYYNPHERRDAS
jgi:CheY-like chemotaxis protein